MRTRLLFISILLPVVLSCADVLETEEGQDLCEVNFCFDGEELTKTSATVKDNYIHDMQIWAFANGSEVDDKANSGGTFKKMRLRKYEHYNFYAVANLGVFPVWNPDESTINSLRYGFKGIEWLRSVFLGVPMSCVIKNVYLDSDQMTVKLPFERMLAEYYVSIDKSNLTDTQLTVTSAKLKQAPTDMYVFRQGSKAVSTEDGDYMSSEDLQVLNAGGPVKLFALENCQGVLLPGNTDQRKKNPSSLYQENAKMCTYLEIKASFTRSLATGEIVSGDNLIYRYYLGEDATTDFSVIRNTRYFVTLVLSELDLNSSTWRISPGEYH